MKGARTATRSYTHMRVAAMVAAAGCTRVGLSRRGLSSPEWAPGLLQEGCGSGTP